MRFIPMLPKVIYPCFCNSIQDHCRISLFYSDKYFKIKNKVFNFIRYKNENLELTIQKIKSSIVQNLLEKSEKMLNPSISPLDLQVYCSSDKIKGHFKEFEIWDLISDDNSFFHVNDKSYKIIRDPPLIETIKLPKIPMVNIPFFPHVTVNVDDVSMECHWYKENIESPNEYNQYDKDDVTFNEVDLTGWQVMSHSFIYKPSEKDIESSIGLLCIPYHKGVRGPSKFLKSSKVQSQPPQTLLQTRLNAITSRTEKPYYRFCSYNILADLYAKSDYSKNHLFPYCPKDALKYEYRSNIIFHEIISYEADVICLQEVDEKMYDSCLEDGSSFYGYGSVYKYKDKTVVEGCATLYNKNKFELFSQQDTTMPNAIEKDSKLYQLISQNSALKSNILNKKAILQVTFLKSKDHNDTILCVANTHLYFLPAAYHIRIIQIAASLSYLERTIEQFYKQHKIKPHVILCGDFNSTPETDIYKYVTAGFLPKTASAWPKKDDPEYVEGVELYHSFNFVSACGEPEYTNFVPGFQACIDYIFVQKDEWEVSKIYPFPSRSDIDKLTALPNIDLGSDHLALLCDLKMSNK